MNEGRLFLCAISELASSYFLRIIFGDVIKNLLTISGHVGQFDSSLAVQNMQAGQPLTTTFFVMIPSIVVLVTKGSYLLIYHGTELVLLVPKVRVVAVPE